MVFSSPLTCLVSVIGSGIFGLSGNRIQSVPATPVPGIDLPLLFLGKLFIGNMFFHKGLLSAPLGAGFCPELYTPFSFLSITYRYKSQISASESPPAVAFPY